MVNMPTIFTHGAIGFTASKLAYGSSIDYRLLIATIVLPILPDSDALLMPLIPYRHPFGHRGFSHSLLFALLTGIVTAMLFVRSRWASDHSFTNLAIFFTLITASHGLFDAMTNGGLGVAFFAPFETTRYFLPWRPIPVSPMSAADLMSWYGFHVIKWELVLFWPFAAAAALFDKRTSWRAALAGLFLIAGIAFWIWALNR
jgi:inner membrane protein